LGIFLVIMADEIERHGGGVKVRCVLAWIPPWILCLLLFLPLLLVERYEVLRNGEWFRYGNRATVTIDVFFLIALFLVGPLRRLSGGQGLLALLFAGAAFGVETLNSYFPLPLSFYPYPGVIARMALPSQVLFG
jgi:hypothetical protein